MTEFTKEELKLLKKLNTPAKIQDFLNSIPVNFGEKGETCMSFRRILKNMRCHCFEGALFAAAVLRFHGFKPLIVDMKGTADDWDHVIAVFNVGRRWGAISKTNHFMLRYREPVYRDIRELVMSYFHEYIDDNDTGKKTLRSFSNPIDLSIFDKINWMTSEEDLWEIGDYIDEVRHFDILRKGQNKELRKADNIEIEAGKITEWKKKV